MSYWFRYLLYRNRYRLTAVYRSAALAGIGVLFFFFLYYLSGTGVFSKITGERGISLFDIAVSWGERDTHGLLRSSLPVLAWGGNQEDYPEEITARSLVTAVLAPFRIHVNDLPDLLASEMPVMAEYSKGRAASLATPKNVPEQTLPMASGALTSDALVGIYFTHTGETYNPTDGTDRINGKQGGVVKAGKALQEVLEKNYGIRVALDDRVNDADYGVSYVESEKTSRQLLEENAKMQVILDIHRDAGKDRSCSLVKVNGKNVAPILFIVGSDARAPFPTWRKNNEFAVQLAEKINQKYPGLCIGVRVKEGRYNQFLHPRALLVEIGSTNNTTDEAMESARMLAQVLAREIAELVPEEVKKGPAAALPQPGNGVGGNSLAIPKAENNQEGLNGQVKREDPGMAL